MPFVLRYLRATVAVYRIRADDVVFDEKAGVSSQILDCLLATTLYPQQLGDPFWYYDDAFWWGYPPLRTWDGHHHHHHDHDDHHHHRGKHKQ